MTGRVDDGPQSRSEERMARNIEDWERKWKKAEAEKDIATVLLS